MKKIREYAKENKGTIKAFVITFIVCMILRTFVIKPIVVSGSSMEPNYHNDETALSLMVGKENIKRGDVVVIDIADRKEAEEYYIIKRIIGLPGEEVKLKGRTVYINNEPLEETYNVLYDEDMLEETYKLRENEYFCLGDNRSHSMDSRYYGPFTLKDIIAHGFFRFPILFRNRK